MANSEHSKILVGLVLFVCQAATVGGCDEATAPSATTDGAGAGGQASTSGDNGGGLSGAGTGSDIHGEPGGAAGAGAAGCEDVPLIDAPLCYGQDSARCCNNDPVSAECVDGHWTCFGFPPPGCNGDWCYFFSSCGPRLKCDSRKEVCREPSTVVGNGGAAGIDSGGAAGIGYGGASDAGAFSALGGADAAGASEGYECVPLP
ncbi:MAG: hypothetical protein ABUL60_36155 [Myxococcales bacterium]